MFFPIFLGIFAISGITLIILTLAKRFELRKKRATFILKAISIGDERAKELQHKMLNLYAEGKDRIVFFVKKELPLKLKKFVGIVVSYLKARWESYFGNIRNSHLIRKEEGISEFFKNISEIEKGNGEIHDLGFIAEDSITPEPPKKERRKRTYKRRKKDDILV